MQTVLDALRARKERFVFEDIEVTLKSTVMAFITMNPGYPGRAELPESLKVQSACSCCRHAIFGANNRKAHNHALLPVQPCSLSDTMQVALILLLYLTA